MSLKSLMILLVILLPGSLGLFSVGLFLVNAWRFLRSERNAKGVKDPL